jgi:hypothetical protein
MSKQIAAVTAKNFSNKLAAFVKAASSQRDTLQDLIRFGAEHYSKHEDSVYLSKALSASVAVRSMATKTLQGYIQDHTNLVWSAPKDGTPAFRKIAKSDHQCDLETFNSTVWYLHSDDGQAKPDWKAESYAGRVAAKLAKEGLPAAEFIKLLEAAAKAQAAKA